MDEISICDEASDNSRLAVWLSGAATVDKASDGADTIRPKIWPQYESCGYRYSLPGNYSCLYRHFR